MNQDLVLSEDLAEVMESAIATGLLSATVTIQEHNTTYTDAGQPNPDPANWTNVSGLVDIQAQAAPANPNLLVISDREQRSIGEIQSYNDLHVLLDTYYPTITTEMRAVVTYVSGASGLYDIQAVENDSQCQMTRLRCVLVTL